MIGLNFFMPGDMALSLLYRIDGLKESIFVGAGFYPRPKSDWKICNPGGDEPH